MLTITSFICRKAGKYYIRWQFSLTLKSRHLNWFLWADQVTGFQNFHPSSTGCFRGKKPLWDRLKLGSNIRGGGGGHGGKTRRNKSRPTTLYFSIFRVKPWLLLFFFSGFPREPQIWRDLSILPKRNPIKVWYTTNMFFFAAFLFAKWSVEKKRWVIGCRDIVFNLNDYNCTKNNNCFFGWNNFWTNYCVKASAWELHSRFSPIHTFHTD